jgi:hypothetical protein
MLYALIPDSRKDQKVGRNRLLFSIRIVETLPISQIVMQFRNLSMININFPGQTEIAKRIQNSKLKMVWLIY